MANIDLDAARAARAEAKHEPNTVTFGGETFELPAEVTFDTIEVLLTGNLREGISRILGDHAEFFWKQEPTVGDMQALTDGLIEAYTGHTVGESLASSASSANGTKRSRRRSPATTASS